MGWLVGYTLGSMAASFLVVRVFDYVVSGATDSASRASVFIATWTAITGQSGMRSLSKTARKFRQRNAVAQDRLDALTKDERR